jgi:hypothetical protein
VLRNLLVEEGLERHLSALRIMVIATEEPRFFGVPVWKSRTAASTGFRDPVLTSTDDPTGDGVRCWFIGSPDLDAVT